MFEFVMVVQSLVFCINCWLFLRLSERINELLKKMDEKSAMPHSLASQKT